MLGKQNEVNGFHRVEVLPKIECRAILRHAIDMRAEGPTLLSWPLFIQPFHDAVLEDALALTQASVGANPVVRPWSLWVRFLRWVMSGGRARSQQTRNPLVSSTLRNKAALRRLP